MLMARNRGAADEGDVLYDGRDSPLSADSADRVVLGIVQGAIGTGGKAIEVAERPPRPRRREPCHDRCLSGWQEPQDLERSPGTMRRVVQTAISANRDGKVTTQKERRAGAEP